MNDVKVCFPDFFSSKVLVAGDVMVDRYWIGSAKKISPEAPVPIVKINKIQEYPGGAANVAMNIASLGAKSKLLGLVGFDQAAEFLRKKLKESNIQYDFVSIQTHPTTVKLRVTSCNQQLLRLDFENKYNYFDSQTLLKKIKKSLKEFNVLVLSDYNKGFLCCAKEIINLAQHMNIPIIVDPKGIKFSKYKGATILTPNLSEFEAVVDFCKTEKVLIDRAMEVIMQYKLSALLITRSEKGMTLFQKGKAPLYFSNKAKEVYDVVGAGDTVIGVISAALSSGKNLEEACFLANIAASLTVGKTGTSTVSAIELYDNINRYSDNSFGILTEDMLKKAVDLSRHYGEKIVMTNGVFDVLHAGHINCLINAKKLGDRLIVAVNSDSSTRRLKGNKRPINSLEQRMTVLSNLKSVDWVVPFYEDTPENLIKKILPDFLVKGGDYKVHEIAGSKAVLKNGGKVYVLRFESGCSSSNIINWFQKK